MIGLAPILDYSQVMRCKKPQKPMKALVSLKVLKFKKNLGKLEISH
jgi:hypothetical protein